MTWKSNLRVRGPTKQWKLLRYSTPSIRPALSTLSEIESVNVSSLTSSLHSDGVLLNKNNIKRFLGLLPDSSTYTVCTLVNITVSVLIDCETWRQSFNKRTIIIKCLTDRALIIPKSSYWCYQSQRNLIERGRLINELSGTAIILSFVFLHTSN